jgi:hypothetical protein
MRLVVGGRSASRLYNIYVRAPRLDDQPDGAVVVAKEGGAFTYGVDGVVDPSYWPLSVPGCPTCQIYGQWWTELSAGAKGVS